MTSSFPEISISTDRLVLRAFEPQDVPALTDMMADELVRTWTTVPHSYTTADATAWVALLAPAERTQGRGLVLGVHEFLTQRLVGSVRLRATDWRLRATEAEVVTAPWARGEGYAGEALRGGPAGCSRRSGSNGWSCGPRPATAPPSRSPRRSAVSARACCAAPGSSVTARRPDRPAAT